MNTSAKGTWEAFVQSNVYAGEFNEDGERREELCYFVVCQDEKGYRFASRSAWTTAGEPFRGEAAELAEAFCAKVVKALANGADPRTSPKWAPIQGMYGSAAWSDAYEIELDARDMEGEVGGGIEEANRMRREAGIGG